MIAHTIQLALAPVFLLVAIGNILNLLTNRLGRVVDRGRALEGRYRETSGMEHDLVVREMRSLDQRIHLIGKAILLLVMSGISIGCTVAMLFVEEMLSINLQVAAAIVFILAIILLMWALLLLLRETQNASAALRIPEELLEKDRPL